jgi:hypothetical protein
MQHSEEMCCHSVSALRLIKDGMTSDLISLQGPHTGYRRTIRRRSRHTTTTIAATAKGGRENSGLNGRWKITF